ncbi:Phosphatidylethanolamine-binding domain-containing protein [Desulfonema limicola]|uniref:Phosphatidylethanolamine-binding domain-containing protein n=1 Tax=Desulfonema limicola TaxID=45656 RepID=A0A975GHQ4_9BACT|nr:hypothetical protein [Desulfonema limicola]QTA81672.1 Phosphatidylethanolamine-binding domain-containing protein [Desulfonema limicola]
MKKFKLLTVFLTFLIFGCATAQIDPNAVELVINFSWEGTNNCSNKSPEIKISNIPKGTKTFKIKLKDLDVPTWNHGGGIVNNDGSGIIKAGALRRGYNGPCPPDGSHIYQFDVKAINEQGIIIGMGKASKSFP